MNASLTTNNLSGAAFAILLLLLATGCSDRFLEVTPKGKLIAKEVSDYDLLLNNNTLLNTGGANAQLYLGDDVAVVDPYFSATEPRIQRLFNWLPEVYDPDQNAAETQSLLSQLYIYNKVIHEVRDAKGGTEAQKNTIRAEAQAGRAWVYFQLINYFGKPYTELSAATDLGFPIITAADVTATAFSRASVQEVYDFIEADLAAAIPHLPSQTPYRIRMSRAAGTALLGKVYVFMGRYEEALPLFDEAMELMGKATAPTHLVDYNAAFAEGGLYTPADPLFGPNLPTISEDTETVYARQFSNFSILSSELVISSAARSLFDASDLRLRFFSETPFPFGSLYPDGLLRRMAPLTNSYGVALPDIILLRAECRARTNDLQGALEDLMHLRRHRIPETDAAVPAEVAANRQLLVPYVFEERTREYAGRGERWFAMRRLSVDPEFGGSSFHHQRYHEDGTVTEIKLPIERLVLKLPAKILLENPGMDDNP